MTDIILLLIGISGGLALGYFYAKSKYQGNRVVEQTEYDNLNRKLIDLASEKSAYETKCISLQEKLNEQKLEVEKLQQKFSLEFENLANRIFSEKTKETRSNIEDILKPLNENLHKFEKKVEEVYVQDTKDKVSLREEVRKLYELNSRISDEANNLTKALKGDTKTQGSWGEFILESVLEKSGLVKDREYFVQQSLRNEEGKLLRPDVIIKLPENKNMIIDSKVSLISYERYSSAESDENKKIFLNEYVASIRKHVKELSPKDYQNIYDIPGLDFVLMFIPIEPAFGLAMQRAPNLFYEALENNIVIVCPSTLLATLRTISNIWKQEKQNKNALEIAKRGGELYDKFVSFTEDLLRVGKSLDDSKKVYVEAMRKLTEGPGNLVSRTHKLKELGAKTTKSISDNLLQRANDENE